MSARATCWRAVLTPACGISPAVFALMGAMVHVLLAPPATSLHRWFSTFLAAPVAFSYLGRRDAPGWRSCWWSAGAAGGGGGWMLGRSGPRLNAAGCGGSACAAARGWRWPACLAPRLPHLHPLLPLYLPILLPIPIHHYTSLLYYLIPPACRACGGTHTCSRCCGSSPLLAASLVLPVLPCACEPVPAAVRAGRTAGDVPLLRGGSA
jgi:hypothetical protein